MGTPESARQYDPKYLQDMSGGDAEFIQEILGTFLETSEDLVRCLQLAAREASPDKGFYVAHTLKGSARSVGADPLGHLCEELERLAKEGDMVGFAAVADRIAPTFVQLKIEMELALRPLAA